MKKSILFLALVVTACGSGGIAANFAPPIATIEGQVTSALSEPPANVRLALVWWTGTLYDVNSSTAVGQDFEVSTNFPSGFTLNVTEVPPKSAFAPDNETAMAAIVAYEDLNGNGKLDFLPADATQEIDHVLGVSDNDQGDLDLVYLTKASGDTPAGFSLRSVAIAGAQIGAQQVLPLATPITLSLTGAPDLRSWACDPPPPPTGPLSDINPELVGATVSCNADGSFSWQKCHQDSACNYAHCENGSVTLWANRPADWPCPVAN